MYGRWPYTSYIYDAVSDTSITTDTSITLNIMHKIFGGLGFCIDIAEDEIEQLEKFVCEMYGMKSCKSTNEGWKNSSKYKSKPNETL